MSRKHSSNRSSRTSPASPAKLGDLLIHTGALTPPQLKEALAQQADSGRPLGVILENHFNVHPFAVTQAWATQMAHLAPHVNPCKTPPHRDALALIDRRQAWQFGLIPLKFVDHEIVIATTKKSLARAVRFAYKHLGPACTFALCEDEQFLESLERYYPMPGARAVLESSTLT